MFLYTIARIEDCQPSKIPSGMRSYVSETRSETQHRERLCAVTLLCSLLDAAGVGTNLNILRNQKGRPHFDVPGAPDFNISHSGGLCACMLGDSPVGIDIQEKIPSLNIEHLSARFFSPAECQTVNDAADPSNAFFTIWTKKEALGKYLGCGVVPVLGADTKDAPEKFGISFGANVFRFGDHIFHLATCAAGLPEYVSGQAGLPVFSPLYKT